MALLNNFVLQKSGLLFIPSEIFKPITFYFMKSISYSIRSILGSDTDKFNEHGFRSSELLAEMNNLGSGINILDPV